MTHFSSERPIIVRQIRNRLSELSGAIYRDRSAIEGWEYVVAGTRQDASPPPSEGWAPYELDTPWGGLDITCWFRARVKVPIPQDGLRAVLILQPGGESACFVNGAPLQGLDKNRDEVFLPVEMHGTTIDVLLESYASPYHTSMGICRFPVAAFAFRDETVRSLYWDLKVAFEAANALENDTRTSRRLLSLVETSLKSLDLNAIGDQEEFRKAAREAQASFKRGLVEFSGSSGMGKARMVGQSHIDTAWLWPLRETRRKVTRTFSTALNYMDQYPDYVYFQSQPQLYEWVKENQPEMWERIKRQVKAGKWELNGAAWVEQDTNVPNGESHVRQFLYGNRFFRKEFGVHTRVFWLPDCFGFSFSLPQIIKKAQIDAFATTKLSSNEYNEFPYDLFRWRGLDGTELLTYQLPWEWRVEPAALLAHWNRFKQKTATDEIPLTFGLGDGGGGPTTEMIENGKRLADLTGFPKAEFGTFQGHFDHLSKTMNWDDLPVFNDELYYEKHRGCQTAQARTKRNNRKSEVALHDAEFLASCAARMGATYPQNELYSAWKLVMLNQFHDILPGSSIAQVYEDADRDYATARNTVCAVTDTALQALAEKIDTAGEGDAVIVWNTLGWRRTDAATVRVPSGDGAEWSILDQKGKSVVSQPVTLGDGSAALVFKAENLPPLGYSLYRLKRSPSITAGGLTATAEHLENAYFSIRLAKDGAISRIFDRKQRREVLASNARGNDLIVFEDYPAGGDAWDIDFNFDEKSAAIRDAVSIEVTEAGPLRATVRVVKRTANSTITQDISIWSILPRIDFQTSVEWNEKHKLLKAAFPVDVLSRKATYEIQFGAIERPTHRSSPVDRARFEVTGHKWIDLSEGDYGVSLLNDSKYGFDVKENTMRISLLRSSVSPDPHADEGHHDFAYSLYPHAGGWQDAGTVQRGHEFNAPLVCWLEKAHEGALPPSWALGETDAPGLVIDTVKKAEDSDAIILRTYESHGGRTEARLKFYAPPRSVTECDLMEENDVPVELNGDTITFEIKPWEIGSFKVNW